MGLGATWQNEYYQTAIGMMTHVFLEMKLYFHLCLLLLMTPQRLVLKLSREQLWRAAFLLIFPSFTLAKAKTEKPPEKPKKGKEKAKAQKCRVFCWWILCCLMRGLNHRDVDKAIFFEDFHGLHVFVVDFHFQSQGLNGVRCCNIVARFAINSPVMAAV